MKPWDVLRKPVEPHRDPISCGEWKTVGGTRVILERLLAHDIVIRFEPLISETLAVSRSSARQIGEFLIELADQIDPK